MDISGLEIRVGILTDGPPAVSDRGEGLHRISNLLIGKGFHWQASTEGVFMGEIELLDTPEGDVRCVNRVSLEDYVASVIGSEMNPDAPMEYLKASSVVSRSWALSKIIGKRTCKANEGKRHEPGLTLEWEENDDHGRFDVCNDDHCQRYQGIPQKGSQRAVEAVRATSGEILTASASCDVIDARFSKCCGGMTEIFSTCWDDTDKPYLQSFPDPWCSLDTMGASGRMTFLRSVLKGYDAATADFHDWSARVSKRAVGERLRDCYGIDIGDLHTIKPLERGKSGRIKFLALEGSKGRHVLGKELPIRRLLGNPCLYSSRFNPEDCGDEWILHGNGWGHGVGLCQIGGANMAAHGKTYREILGFYYPETRITKTIPDECT